MVMIPAGEAVRGRVRGEARVVGAAGRCGGHRRAPHAPARSLRHGPPRVVPRRRCAPHFSFSFCVFFLIFWFFSFFFFLLEIRISFSIVSSSASSFSVCTFIFLLLIYSDLISLIDCAVYLLFFFFFVRRQVNANPRCVGIASVWHRMAESPH